MISRRFRDFSSAINLTFIITVFMIITSIVLPLLYREEIISFGQTLLLSYGQERIDFILYLITAVSSTPLALPVWIYAVLGSMLGYEPLRLILVMGLGSMTGSTITYFIARYLGKSKFIRRNFPNIENHPWTRGRSIWVVSLILFTGAASPIPFDILYAACGMKRFPILLFAPVLFLAFLIKYAYLFYGYDLIQSYSTLYFNL